MTDLQDAASEDQARQDQATLTNSILDGLDEFCDLLTQASTWKYESETSSELTSEYAQLTRLAHTVERFWLLNQSALPATVLGAVANAFTRTLANRQLAVPIRQVHPWQLASVSAELTGGWGDVWPGA